MVNTYITPQYYEEANTRNQQIQRVAWQMEIPGLSNNTTGNLKQKKSRCFMSYLFSFVGYLYVSGSGLITSVEEERANLSAIVYL